MGTGLAVAGLVASIVGTGASMKEASKTRSRKRAQNERIKATNASKAATERRRAFREERVRRSQLMAEAEAGGFAGSSTELSGVALSGTRADESAARVSGALETTNAISAGNQSIADSQARQQLFSNVSAIGSNVFQSAGGFETLDNAFSKE